MFLTVVLSVNYNGLKKFLDLIILSFIGIKMTHQACGKACKLATSPQSQWLRLVPQISDRTPRNYQIIFQVS